MVDVRITHTGTIAARKALARLKLTSALRCTEGPGPGFWVSESDYRDMQTIIAAYQASRPLRAYREVAYDLGPNVRQAGDGDTEQEAEANMRTVKYGYSLRFDYITMPEARKEEISKWFQTLSVAQLEMIADFVEAAK